MQFKMMSFRNIPSISLEFSIFLQVAYLLQAKAESISNENCCVRYFNAVRACPWVWWAAKTTVVLLYSHDSSFKYLTHPLLPVLFFICLQLSFGFLVLTGKIHMQCISDVRWRNGSKWASIFSNFDF